MQLFALDESQKLIFVDHAQKHQSYQCLECYGTVRVRGGSHRQRHFYHTDHQRICRQSGKSMTHLQVQYWVQKTLPSGECQLEVRFSEINRIADVVWFPKKIIFEIQCSPITAEEVKERNKNYHTLGYQVVWILHDKRYNQWRFSAAEKYLRAHPHYFTNIDSNGEGYVYDQYDLEKEGFRSFVSRSFPISLDTPKVPVISSLSHLQHRSWKIHFEGDFFDYCFEKDFDPQKFPLPLKPPTLTFFQVISSYFRWYVFRPYRLLFQILLERACR